MRKVAASRGGKEGNNAFAADFGEYLIRGYETDPDEAGQLIKVTRYLFPATCQQCSFVHLLFIDVLYLKLPKLIISVLCLLLLCGR